MLLPLKAVISQKIRKDGKSVIFYQYCFSSTNRVLLSTEIAVPKSCWNAKRQCISRGLPIEIGDFEELNGELGRIRKIIEAIIEHGLNKSEPKIGVYVKSIFKPDFNVESLQNTQNVISFKKREVDFFAEIDNYNKSKHYCPVKTKGAAETAPLLLLSYHT